ncbi:hypothetical protein C1645_817013 [Glomus cerebriforme]|uniref:Uncharacterized protein n=1 Tax=Glomus cerebriforme TaxID=658196 RepID=A0A397TB99_9GLOM|nr:hypothetical protein C1645_817013 [Glomus cerebriforme]
MKNLNEDIELIIIEQDVEIPVEKDKKSEKGNKTDEEIDNNLTFPLSIDPEDFCGTILANATMDKMHLPNTKWPNDIYQEFMEIVMEYQLSNSCSDKIINLINNSQNSTDKNLLPKSTKKGYKFININEFLYMKFKTSDINKEFVFQYQDNNTSIRTYSKQFESEWWKITEKTIPIDNDLLSIIIYTDATMCDHLGKTLEYPIYIC